jgi:hypothetical protein
MISLLAGSIKFLSAYVAVVIGVRWTALSFLLLRQLSLSFSQSNYLFPCFVISIWEPPISLPLVVLSVIWIKMPSLCESRGECCCALSAVKAIGISQLLWFWFASILQYFLFFDSSTFLLTIEYHEKLWRIPTFFLISSFSHEVSLYVLRSWFAHRKRMRDACALERSPWFPLFIYLSI